MNHLYIFKCNEYHKIGIASDVPDRVAQMQIGNPYPLEVVAFYQFENSIPVEQSVHQRFSKQWKQGEWFKLSDKDIELINTICDNLGGIRIDEQVEVDDSADDGEEQLNPKDIEAMLARGWRIEVRMNGRYYQWRRGTAENREQISGGYFEDLPQEYKDNYYRNKARRNGTANTTVNAKEQP